MKVEFLDSHGSVVRQFSSAKEGPPAQRLTPKVGVNVMRWGDLRRPPPTQLPGVLLFSAPVGGGAQVPPGAYQVRLTVGPTVLTQPLEIRLDPRIQVTP
ncbi:MAG: hypothetical protein U0163_10620 [Gemmatimonadaceae bacterium]